jgi:hypothetical protein
LNVFGSILSLHFVENGRMSGFRAIHFYVISFKLVFA